MFNWWMSLRPQWEQNAGWKMLKALYSRYFVIKIQINKMHWIIAGYPQFLGILKNSKRLLGQGLSWQIHVDSSVRFAFLSVCSFSP